MSRGVMGSNHRNRRYEGGVGNDRWRLKNFTVFQQDRNRACEMSGMSSDTYTDPNRNRVPLYSLSGEQNGRGRVERIRCKTSCLCSVDRRKPREKRCISLDRDAIMHFLKSACRLENSPLYKPTLRGLGVVNSLQETRCWRRSST